MMAKMHIRQEQEPDFPAVFLLNSMAFGQESEAKLVDALRKNSKVFVPELSLVAVLEDKIVGHILFTKIRIVNPSHIYESLALAPMAVDSAFRKKGIGGQLIRHGLRKATELGFMSVIVLGHEHYYPAFGFVPADKWHIKAPFEVPVNAFMAMELMENALQNCAGTVQYPEEFKAV